MVGDGIGVVAGDVKDRLFFGFNDISYGDSNDEDQPDQALPGDDKAS